MELKFYGGYIFSQSPGTGYNNDFSLFENGISSRYKLRSIPLTIEIKNLEDEPNKIFFKKANAMPEIQTIDPAICMPIEKTINKIK